MYRTHPNIQFEISYLVNDMPFLDVLILNQDNELHTTLYKTTTDVPYFYIHILSIPPPPTSKTGIIYSQALRYHSIISNGDDLGFHLQQLSISLIKRAIILALLLNNFSRCAHYREMISYNPIHGLLVTNYLSFIPFNLDTAPIGQILHEHWHIIQEDDDLRDIASATPIVAFERNTNIKDLIVHTKFTSPNTGYDSIVDSVVPFQGFILYPILSDTVSVLRC